MPEVQLRRMVGADREMLLSWRNHPEIVRLSMSQHTVTESEHNDWFLRTLESSNVLPFIVEISGKPAGHIRFDKAQSGSARISVYLLPEFTGRGYGVAAINKSLLHVNLTWPGITVVAEVRCDNYAAQSAFRKCGFLIDFSDHCSSLVVLTRTFTGNEQENVELYERLIGIHGESYRALNWGSREGQVRRFEVLAGIGDLNGKAILDVGCGLAHFREWLGDKGIDTCYTGLDITTEFLDKAQKCHPDARFINGSILAPECLNGEMFDYVFASGIFSYFIADGDAAVETAIHNMWRAARKGIAFNCLSAWATDKDSDEYYADPGFLLEACRRLSAWVVLRHDYHPRDVSFYVTRERRPQ